MPQLIVTNGFYADIVVPVDNGDNSDNGSNGGNTITYATESVVFSLPQDILFQDFKIGFDDADGKITIKNQDGEIDSKSVASYYRIVDFFIQGIKIPDGEIDFANKQVSFAKISSNPTLAKDTLIEVQYEKERS